MSKKQLNVTDINNELAGASLYFSPATSPLPQNLVASVSSSSQPVQVAKTLPTRNVENTPEAKTRLRESHPANTPASKLASSPETLTAPEQTAVMPKTDPSPRITSQPASKPASTISSPPGEIVELIRKTVKQVGKETLFVRMTPEEKRSISTVVYAFNEMYHHEGRKTTENEIARIALAFTLEEYRQNGQHSVLARVLAALNA